MVERHVDLGLQRLHIHGFGGEARAEFLHFGRLFEIQSGLLYARDEPRQLFLDRRLIGRLVGGQRPFHLRQQVMLEELRDLAAPGMKNAVNAEIQIGLIELEKLHQFRLQPLEASANRHSRTCPRPFMLRPPPTLW